MATPASVYCAEKWRLLMLFMQAAAAYLRLETAQIQAVIAEAEEPECSDLEIEEARQRKNEA